MKIDQSAHINFLSNILKYLKNQWYYFKALWDYGHTITIFWTYYLCKTSLHFQSLWKFAYLLHFPQFFGMFPKYLTRILFTNTRRVQNLYSRGKNATQWAPSGSNLETNPSANFYTTPHYSNDQTWITYLHFPFSYAD